MDHTNIIIIVISKHLTAILLYICTYKLCLIILTNGSFRNLHKKSDFTVFGPRCLMHLKYILILKIKPGTYMP